LTCTTPGTLLEWSFFLVPEGETMARRYYRVLHSESFPAKSDIRANSITFTFSRISSQGSLPLISRIVINPVRDYLNGTEVNCTDIITSNTTSTYIKVINESTMTSSTSELATLLLCSLSIDQCHSLIVDLVLLLLLLLLFCITHH
jgi:hypothetical protein